jgi:hypothetical protein
VKNPVSLDFCIEMCSRILPISGIFFSVVLDTFFARDRQKTLELTDEEFATSGLVGFLLANNDTCHIE